MKRQGHANWEGGLKGGRGSLSTESGALSDLPYSFAKRFGSEQGTNPEELIAAAHTGCFTMALSAELEKAGLQPQKIETTAAVHMKQAGEGWNISEVKLSTQIIANPQDHERIEKAAAQAKQNCPVSRLLNAYVTLEIQNEASMAPSPGEEAAP